MDAVHRVNKITAEVLTIYMGKLPGQGNSGWKIKWYVQLCVGSFREYGLLFEAMQLIL